MLKFLKALLIILVVIAVGLYGGYRYLEMKMSDIDNAKLKSDLSVYKVKSGATAYTIISDLSLPQEDRILYKIWLRLHPEFSKFKAGTFSLKGATNLTEALKLLKNSQELSFNFTIVEGTRFDVVLKRLSKQENLTQDFDLEKYKDIFELNKDNPEGLLMADTYTYTIGDKASEVIKRSYADLIDFLNNEWEQKAEKLPLKTPYDALILASIVEKETSLEEEYPLVAAVFINRLNKGMKLQTDPTVIYGVKDHYDGNIRRSDLADVNPYNTYVIDGLPPTPIAIASKKAIHAVLHPADVPYLFFVATGHGGHTFTNNIKEHNKAVRTYLTEQKAQKKSKIQAITTLQKQVNDISSRMKEENEQSK